MKNTGYLSLLTMLVGFSLHANVTPAQYALKQVKVFLDKKAEDEVFRALPPHKARSYITDTQATMGRGKFSEEEGGFADFAGNSNYTVVLAGSEQYTHVECYLSATAVVVPFAKQVVPVIEEEINHQQLILKRNRVRCTLVN